MSILNSVMNVFKLTGEDDYDEYDDYDEEFEDDEDDKGSARKKLFSGSHKNNTMKIMIQTAGQTIRSL